MPRKTRAFQIVAAISSVCLMAGFVAHRSDLHEPPRATHAPTPIAVRAAHPPSSPQNATPIEPPVQKNGEGNAVASNDTTIQSVWTSSAGDWKGCLVWGDNHAEFQQATKSFTTRYLSTDTAENLSTTMSDNTNSTSNAYMVYF